nr:DUF5700 domain-containing putative Zn-dependent protease [Anaeromyxobacter sp. SG17]
MKTVHRRRVPRVRHVRCAARRRAELQRCFAAWQQADLPAAAERARRYLPTGARLRATVYLVVKPNSFVFELATNPAIFFAVGADAPDPAVIQNTVAHELHHVGAASVADRLASLAEPRRTAALWTGAFSEGIAMRAAAGGPDVHPHAERARWDADLARAPEDLGAVSAFLLDVAEGRLVGDAMAEAGHLPRRWRSPSGRLVHARLAHGRRRRAPPRPGRSRRLAQGPAPSPRAVPGSCAHAERER